MKKRELILLITFLAVSVILLVSFFNLTGKVVSDIPSFGPSQTEQACMLSCMKCTSPGVGCTGDQNLCTAQCNVAKPEENEEQSCVSSCVKKKCSEFDFSCQEKNREKCDKQCGMIKAPDESEMSAEQLCISNCVNAESPGTRCQASQTGETGNELCQRCAASCVHLYEGPCLDDEKLTARKKECETCENCYGEPLMGDSGEGWECIVNVECKDASEEFGDNPGIGEGIAKVVSSIGKGIGSAFEAVGDFFSGIFGGGAVSDSSSVSEPATNEPASAGE